VRSSGFGPAGSAETELVHSPDDNAHIRIKRYGLFTKWPQLFCGPLLSKDTEKIQKRITLKEQLLYWTVR